jgi:hypothetical protein
VARARTLSVVLAGISLIAAAPESAAEVKKVKTRLVFDPFAYTPPSGKTIFFFSGDVKVSRTHKFKIRRKCVTRRQVQVFRDEPTGEDTFIGKERSDPFGTFIAAQTTDLDEVPGTYYAKVSQKKSKTKSHKLKCLGDRSLPVTVHVP